MRAGLRLTQRSVRTSYCARQEICQHSYKIYLLPFVSIFLRIKQWSTGVSNKTKDFDQLIKEIGNIPMGVYVFPTYQTHNFKGISAMLFGIHQMWLQINTALFILSFEHRVPVRQLHVTGCIPPAYAPAQKCGAGRARRDMRTISLLRRFRKFHHEQDQPQPR